MFPLNADKFREDGWLVEERQYGTPMYEEMFKLLDTSGNPFLEVRRRPKNTLMFSPYSCHVRLVNAYCYADNAAQLMQQFIARYFYEFQRISRIDICLDFEWFDSGDNPQSFINRYVKGVYTKINQADISMHGLDCWDGRFWNSVKWGSKKSMVTTKLYDKTMELRQVHDKPYIRQAWAAAGLVEDWQNLTKFDKNGKLYKPVIWRLEFSVCSGTKNWFVIENRLGKKKQLVSVRNTLDRYETRAQLLDVFWSLQNHYFHFKKKVKINDEWQRKDRCPDKELFKANEPATFYKIANPAEQKAERVTKTDLRLLRMLYELRVGNNVPEVYNACNVLITMLERLRYTQDIHRPYEDDERQLLQRLISLRVKSHDRPLSEDIETIKTLLAMEKLLWQDTT